MDREGLSRIGKCVMVDAPLVDGADIDPQLRGILLTKDAAQGVQDLLDRAVGAETCFIWCWRYRPAEESRRAMIHVLKRFANTYAPVNCPYPNHIVVTSETSRPLITGAVVANITRGLSAAAGGSDVGISASEVESAHDCGMYPGGILRHCGGDGL